MAEGKLESRDFDRWVTLSEKAVREDAIASNDAFVLAMAKAIKRKREKVQPGTFVDPSPTYARRIRGEIAMSPCGSPAAMCAESGSQHSAANTLK